MEAHPEAPLGMELHEVDTLHPEAPSSSSSTGKRYGLESESSDMRRSAALGFFQVSSTDDGTQLPHFNEGVVRTNQAQIRLICREKKIYIMYDLITLVRLPRRDFLAKRYIHVHVHVHTHTHMYRAQT